MTNPHAVLVVDADPKGLESLVYGFQGAEWRMTACPSPETASLLVKASAAQIVVVASRTEHEKLHTLVRQLRAKEATRSLPVLVLGPEDLRATLAESPDVDLLTLPAFVRDVLTASELLVATRGEGAPGEEPCLRASIASGHTLSIVRSMNGLARSGHLRLERNGRVGEILFHQGELTAASLGPLQAMAAVQHLMIWNDGKLELRLRQVPRRGQLHLSASEFLLELDRFQRDYAHAMKEIGPASTVYTASQERLQQAGSSVPAEVTPVVRLCDGKRTLSDIVDESPFRVLDTVRILGRLAEIGILTRADGKKVTGAVGAHAAGEEFLDTARIVGSPPAWPMPAPIGGFPTSEPDPLAAPPEPFSEATPEAVPEPAVEPPKAVERPRRQTREIGVPVATASRPDRAVTAPLAAQPASVAPAPAVLAPPPAPTPVAPAPPVAAAAARPVAPASVAPAAPTGVPVTPAPLAAARPAGPVATLMQASGAAGSKTSSPSLATKLGMPATAGSGAATDQPAAAASPAASPTATIKFAAPGAAPVSDSAIPEPIAAPSTGPNATGAVTQMAGVIESRKGDRRSQQNLRVVTERPSVVVDAMATESGKTPRPAASSSGSLPRVPPPSHSPEAIPPGAASARITGVLQVAPSRRTAGLGTPPPPARIQVDASLSAPPPAGAPTPPPASAPTAGRMTGEMRTAPSSRTTRPLARATPASSFQIDPSLATKPEAAAGAGAPRRSDSQKLPGYRRRASGGFSAVESDFFAREADLYKEEKPESFADLDAAKPKPGGKPGGKPGRPYRR